MKILSKIKQEAGDIIFRSRRPDSRMQAKDKDTTNAFFIKMHFIIHMPITATYPKPQDDADATAVECYYCKQPCQFSTYYQLNQDGQLKGWKCDRHPYTVQYIAVPSATHFAFHFSTVYDQKEYSIEAYKLPQGEQWDLRCGSQVLIHLDKIPDHINPESIDRRIQSLLFFC